MQGKIKLMKLPTLKPETPRIRKLIGFSVFVMLCFCLIVGWQAWSSYRVSLGEARENATRVARTLADHAELTFLSVDLSLRRAVERQYFNTLFGGNLPEYMEHNFRMWVDELPQISAMMLINEKGYVEASAYDEGFENFVVAAKSVKGEESDDTDGMAQDSNFYFTAGFLKDDPEREIIIMSRKLNKLDGSYGGIVMAAINPDYFVDFFDAIVQGDYHVMRMALTDGTIMVEGPNPQQVGKQLGSVLSNQLQATTVHEFITEQADVDGENKLISSTQLASFPASIAIVLDSRDYLAFWQSNQLQEILFLAIFLLFGTALSLFAVTLEQQIKRVQESEASAVLASQSKSEFLANVSHEFRTPLNAIIGFSEMLMSEYYGALKENQKERLKDIYLCGNHLLHLINDILEFSKGEAGKLELREGVVDMRDLLDESARIMREKMNQKQLTLTTTVDEAHPWIHGDARKLRQVLLNLLSNALKFTPEGGSIHMEAGLRQDGRMRIRVRDTGIGMAEADIPKALSVFGQAHRNQSLEGTGLGLPLCKIFSELHGGSLSLQSQLGKGTTVDIILPRRRVLSTEEAEARRQQAVMDFATPEKKQS